MAIQWGYSSGRLSLGIDMWYSGDPNSGSVTLTAVYYVRADGYGHNFSSTIRFGGETSGAKGYSFYSPTGGDTVKEVHRVQWTKATAYGVPVTSHTSFTTDTLWNGGKPSASASIQIPARAYQTPSAPYSVSARRDSDSQATITWAQNVSSAAPVTGFGIERQSLEDPVWRNIGNADGAARSFTDTAIEENQRYTYRVWATNGKNSSQSASNDVYTTPSAPVNVKAVKTATGDVEITWEPTSSYTPTGYLIYDNGAQIAQTSSAATRWTHSRPSTATTHTYRVRATNNGLQSALSAESNRVQLLAPPNAPQLTRAVRAYEPGEFEFQWIHAPADSSAQTSAKIRYRKIGTTTWTTLTVNGSKNSYRTTLQPGSYEWQAQTWGVYKPNETIGASPWSPIEFFSIQNRPTVNILAPTSTVNVAFLNVTWAYYQRQATPQQFAEINLTRHEDNVLLESVKVEEGASSYTLSTKLDDRKRYTLSIRVQSFQGLQSDWASTTFYVSFPLPPQPEVLTKWNEEKGYAQITIINPQAGAGQAQATYNQLHRSIDGGKTWELAANHVAIGGSTIDTECLTNGTNLYKATAITAQETAASSQPTPLHTNSHALWISGAPGYTLAVPLHYNPTHTTRTGLTNRKVIHFAGRARGVELTGIQREEEISVSAALFDEDWELIGRLKELASLPAPFLFRDPLGRRVYCSISKISYDRRLSGLWSVKFKIEEVERE